MNGSAPAITVVVPAYNAADTVVETIQGVLRQTMEDLEVVVVDDGSGDDTAARVEAIADPRLRLLRQENGGAAAARNAGIRQARGRWVAFLDSDDVWLPHKLEVQLAVLESNPGVSAVQSGAYFVDDRLRPLEVRRCVQPDDSLLTFLRFQNLPNAASTWVIERDALERIGMFDTSLAILEDWDISIKAARHCNPISIEEPLSLYRVHPGNRSRDLEIHIEPGLRILARLFADPTLPRQVRDREREIYARLYTMFAGGALRAGQRRACARWGLRAVRADPRALAYLGSLPARRLRRRLSRRGVETEGLSPLLQAAEPMSIGR